MRARFLILLLCLAGCGDAEVPDGYATYEGNGVSFVHPEGWRSTTESLGHDITEVRFEAGEAAVSLTVQPDVGERFDSQIEGERAVLESAGGRR